MNRGGSSRGGRGTSGGATSRGRGGGRGGAASGGKESRGPQLDLSKYMDQRIRVKFVGGREVTGVLKGYDPLVNLVLDEVEEPIRDIETGNLVEPLKVRQLGLIVAKGMAVTVLNPAKGYEAISNPFVQDEEEVFPS